MQWQTSASALMIFCQSCGRLGILKSFRYMATFFASFGAVSTSYAEPAMTREPAIMLRPVRWRSVQHPIDAGPSNPKPAGDFPRA